MTSPVATLARELIQIPSVVGQDDGRPIAARLFRYLRDVGLDPVADTVSEDAANVSCVLDSGRPGPTLLFAAHTDVAPPGPIDGWTHPPFSGAVDAKSLYGRGAALSKGNLAALLAAVASWTEDPPPGRVVVLATPDARGPMDGIRHFIEERLPLLAPVDAAVVCEPTPDAPALVQGGSTRVRVSIEGVTGPTSVAAGSLNPIPLLVEYLGIVRQWEQGEVNRRGYTPEFGWPAVTPTGIKADERFDRMIPARAVVDLEVRSGSFEPPDQMLHVLEERLKSLVDGWNASLAHGPERRRRDQVRPRLLLGSRFRAWLTVEDRKPPVQIPPDAPIARAAMDAAKRAGRAPRPGSFPEATDGTWLGGVAHIPNVALGGGDPLTAYHPDEHIGLEELQITCEMYRHLPLAFARSVESARS